MIDFENNQKLYYSIKEVASHFGVNESLLRFWEKEFDEINPKKTSGGIRQYTRKDIESIQLVYSFVKVKGMTIEGARQALKTEKDAEKRRIEVLNRLEAVRNDLEGLKKTFDNFDEYSL